MSKEGNCCSDGPNTTVNVSVDVTKIVKYVCCAGVFIVGIIFGTNCYHKMLQKGLFKL